MYNLRERKHPGKAVLSASSKKPKLSINPRPLSLFERLPLELHWALFDYVPALIRMIMKITPNMYIRVLEYARETTQLQLVDDININWGQHFCSLSVPNDVVDLFELRCALRIYRWKLRNEPTIRLTHSCYLFHYRDANDDMLEAMRDALGKRVGAVSPLSRWCGWSTSSFQAVGRLLEGIKINKFTYLDDLLPQCITDCILRLAPNIKKMELEFERTEHIDTVTFLLDLSASVTSLNIMQRSYMNVVDHRRFLGVVDEKWAPVIMQMFSKKLDKLSITNVDHPYFLSKRCADFLIRHLPLQEKKVWFTATCSHYPTGTISSENGYVIEVSQGPFEDLMIQHATRQHEVCD